MTDHVIEIVKMLFQIQSSASEKIHITILAALGKKSAEDVHPGRGVAVADAREIMSEQMGLHSGIKTGILRQR